MNVQLLVRHATLECTNMEQKIRNTPFQAWNSTE